VVSCSSCGVTHNRRQSILAILTAVAVALLMLHRPLMVMSKVVWGPADPWSNGDFVGAHWLFWASTTSHDPAALLNWPWGEGPILVSFPNPFDAWLLGSLLSGVVFPLGWNLMMLGHHLLNVAATVVLARSAGARTLHAAAAGALIASTPLILHEHAMGHTLTAALWPGLFALAAALTGRGWLAGIWIGIQGLAYLYTGLAVGLVALLLRRSWGLGLGLLMMAPYLALLWPQLESAHAVRPPDGFTVLPLDALWGGSGQSFLRLQPLLGLCVLAAVAFRSRPIVGRLILAASLLLLVALGPEVVLHRGDSVWFYSPLRALFSVPGLSRMHHPIRLAMVAVPLLAVAGAVAMGRKRAVYALVVIGLSGLNWRSIDNTAAWSASPKIPGASAAEWLKSNSVAVVDLDGSAMGALSLQTIHGKPILSGFHPRDRPPPGVDASVFERLNLWAKGIPQPTLPARLKQLGFSHVVVVDRGEGRRPSERALKTQLGPAVFPGVYAL
jgi:hypothetical protein